MGKHGQDAPNKGRRGGNNSNIMIHNNNNDRISEVSDAALHPVQFAHPRRPLPPRGTQMAKPLERNLNSSKSPSPRKNNYLQSNRYMPQKMNSN